MKLMMLETGNGSVVAFITFEPVNKFLPQFTQSIELAGPSIFPHHAGVKLSIVVVPLCDDRQPDRELTSCLVNAENVSG